MQCFVSYLSSLTLYHIIKNIGVTLYLIRMNLLLFMFMCHNPLHVDRATDQSAHSTVVWAQCAPCPCCYVAPAQFYGLPSPLSGDGV